MNKRQAFKAVFKDLPPSIKPERKAALAYVKQYISKLERQLKLYKTYEDRLFKETMDSEDWRYECR